MEKKAFRFSSISDLLRQMGLPSPTHPLVALVNYDLTPIDLSDAGNWFVLDFYKITFKRTFEGSVKYGAGSYDFKEGGMAFLEPGQVVQKTNDPNDYEGYALYFHPDLLRRHGLAEKIHHYGFFSYAVSEALFISEKEKATMNAIFQVIDTELNERIDQFSDEVIVSQLELLLNQSNRFYHRQFVMRKNSHHELIDRMNKLLSEYFENALVSGLPSPQAIAADLRVSQRYLSDMLKTLTGKTTQEHIHLLLIEKAKSLLQKNKLSTAEIAYRLGFEHPQSFNKLFKQKTNLSPAAFRRQIPFN